MYGSKRRKESSSTGEAEQNGEKDGVAENEEEEGLGKGEKVAFIMVAETVGFWNLAVGTFTRP